MKIGIITIHKSPNYGACLQTYGLYAFIQACGIDCEVIDLLRPTHSAYIPSKKYVPYRQKKVGLIIKSKHYIIKKLKFLKKPQTLTKETQHKFDDFNNKINYSQTYYSIDELYQNPPQYDIYISGSDQLWNPTIGFCIEPYFLTFVKNGGRKVSYATSIGISELLDNEKADFTKWLSKYDSISVREESAREMLSEMVNQTVTQVCDPSFLLEPSKWRELMVVPSVKDSSYILLFTLNHNKPLLDFCCRLSKESGKQLVYLCLYLKEPNTSSLYVGINEAGPQDFLGYVASADMVVTDSFHGTVFSLILGVENFFAYVPSSQKRGKRILDLLKTYNLLNHVLSNDLHNSYKDLSSLYIDKEAVSQIMVYERKRSQDYLLGQLKKYSK